MHDGTAVGISLKFREGETMDNEDGLVDGASDGASVGFKINSKVSMDVGMHD